MAVIYATPYDAGTLQCTAASMPAGVESFFDVMVRRGAPDHAGPRMLLYPGWAFTDFVLHIDPADNFRLESAQIGG